MHTVAHGSDNSIQSGGTVFGRSGNLDLWSIIVNGSYETPVTIGQIVSVLLVTAGIILTLIYIA